MENPENKTEQPEKKSWLKRIGWIGFFFFLLKGIGWLVVGYMLSKGILDQESWLYRLLH